MPCLAAICALQLLRTSAPVPALLGGLAVLVVDTLLGPSVPVILVFCDLLFTATLYGSRRTSRVLVGVVGAFIVGTAVLSAVFAPDWRMALVVNLAVSPIPLVSVWWAMNVRQQREAAEAQRARADHLARIAELDRQAAVAAERARMARDLHDVIAGHLSAIAIQSEALLSTVDGNSATARAVVKSVRENSVAALEEMRSMIGLLRAADQPDQLTAPARLRDLDPLLDSARAAGLRVRTEIDGDDVPAAVDHEAYRIVQEALTNAVKHAPGSHAEVSVRRAGAVLVVQVVNDLTGPGSTGGPGTGLTSMRERASALGGVLDAGPRADSWRVRAELPLEGHA